MLKQDQEEAERIAQQLLNTHRNLKTVGYLGLFPDRIETLTLAKAIQMFQGKVTVDQLSPLERAQIQHEATL
jgi:UDP-N-acetylglucosamine enolpyruvyl transferase